MSRPIGEVRTRVFGPGEVIFRGSDDPKGEAFMVRTGRVEIRTQISGEDRLLRVLTGELLGELGLFGNAPCSATAVAAAAVTLMVIPANRLTTSSATIPPWRWLSSATLPPRFWRPRVGRARTSKAD